MTLEQGRKVPQKHERCFSTTTPSWEARVTSELRSFPLGVGLQGGHGAGAGTREQQQRCPQRRGGSARPCQPELPRGCSEDGALTPTRVEPGGSDAASRRPVCRARSASAGADGANAEDKARAAVPPLSALPHGHRPQLGAVRAAAADRTPLPSVYVLLPDVLKAEVLLKRRTHPLLCQIVVTIHTSGYFFPKSFCFSFELLQKAEYKQIFL